METNIVSLGLTKQEDTEKIKEAGSKLVASTTAISQMRIQDILKVQKFYFVQILLNFEELRDPNKSRGEYISDLKEAVEDYYSYNEQLIDMFFDLFSPQEVNQILFQAIQFFEANEIGRAHV